VRQPRARIRRAPGIRAHRPGHTAGRARRVRPGQQRPARGQELLIGPAFPPVRERVPVALARPSGRPRSCGRWRRAVLAGRDKQAVRARRHGRAKQPPLGQMQVLGLVIRARPCTWHPTPRPLSFRNCDSRSGASGILPAGDLCWPRYREARAWLRLSRITPRGRSECSSGPGAGVTWISVQLLLVCVIISFMACCEPCEMDREFCPHRLAERRRAVADDPDYSRWAKLDTPRAWERPGNGEHLQATDGRRLDLMARSRCERACRFIVDARCLRL
jgi:hypothetical protein